jgi:hypothetical protein
MRRNNINNDNTNDNNNSKNTKGRKIRKEFHAEIKVSTLLFIIAVSILCCKICYILLAPTAEGIIFCILH